MNINFNLDGFSQCGGCRVILELAERLTRRGYDVSITAVASHRSLRLFSNDCRNVRFNFKSPPNLIEQIVRKKLFKQNDLLTNTELLRKIAPECDINIATHSFTARPTFESKRGDPYYLVQNYEPWFFKDLAMQRRAEESYLLPLKRLCVSKWLQEKVGGTYVGNGVNTEVFYPKCAFANKIPRSVVYLFRGVDWKKDGIALETLEQLQNANVYIVVQGRNVKKLPRNSFNVHVDLSDEELADIYSRGYC